VLVFRDQALEPADLMRVGARFGEPCHYPFVTGLDGFPFIFEVVKEESETVNFGGNWHSDTTYLAQPPLATLLYALETPKTGGDTLFTSTYAAYDALSEGMRAMVDKLIGINSASLKVTGGRRKMHSTIGSMKVHDTENAGQYEAEHPVVRTHPETGRRALYLSRSHTISFKDMTEEESRPLIDFLQAHQIRPEFTCRVRWSPGTLTVWDNRCTQHNAVNDYHGQRRRMRRLTVGAQIPR
jgi:taurine dioxygenase